MCEKSIEITKKITKTMACMDEKKMPRKTSICESFTKNDSFIYNITQRKPTKLPTEFIECTI